MSLCQQVQFLPSCREMTMQVVALNFPTISLFVWEVSNDQSYEDSIKLVLLANL